MARWFLLISPAAGYIPRPRNAAFDTPDRAEPFAGQAVPGGDSPTPTPQSKPDLGRSRGYRGQEIGGEGAKTQGRAGDK